jgi:hypothetical protein
LQLLHIQPSIRDQSRAELALVLAVETNDEHGCSTASVDKLRSYIDNAFFMPPLYSCALLELNAHMQRVRHAAMFQTNQTIWKVFSSLWPLHVILMEAPALPKFLNATAH